MISVEASDPPVSLTRSSFARPKSRIFGHTFASNHQVFRLQITMNEADFVRFGERIGNLCRHGDGLAKWNRARGKQSAHRFPIHQFHGDVARAVHLPEFINGDDVWVIERAGGAGFPLKAR